MKWYRAHEKELERVVAIEAAQPRPDGRVVVAWFLSLARDAKVTAGAMADEMMRLHIAGDREAYARLYERRVKVLELHERFRRVAGGYFVGETPIEVRRLPFLRHPRGGGDDEAYLTPEERRRLALSSSPAGKSKKSSSQRVAPRGSASAATAPRPAPASSSPAPAARSRKSSSPAPSSSSSSPAPAARSKSSSPATPKKRSSPARHRGGRVNPTIPLPRAPGPWVDEDRNHVTGEEYRKFRTGCDFREGAAMIRRSADAQGIAGGGFRSRGPVLHAMRACKLGRWYDKAAEDGQLWNAKKNRPYTERELLEMEARERAKHGPAGPYRNPRFDPSDPF